MVVWPVLEVVEEGLDHRSGVDVTARCRREPTARVQTGRRLGAERRLRAYASYYIIKCASDDLRILVGINLSEHRESVFALRFIYPVVDDRRWMGISKVS